MKTKKLPLLFLVFLSLLIYSVFSVISPTKNTLPPSTYILNLDVSNLPEDKFSEKMEQRFPLPSILNISVNNFSYPIKAADLNLVRDDSKLLLQIKSETKTLRGMNLLAKIFPTLLQPKTYPLVISYDSDNLRLQLAKISKEVEQPFIPTQFAYENKKIIIKPGQYGKRLNTRLLEEDIYSALSNYDIPAVFTSKFISSGYLPSDADLAQLKSKAESLIGKSLEFKLEDSLITIEDKTIIDWLGFTSTLNNDEVKDYISNLSNRFARDPIDASFQVENGKVTEFKPAYVGIALDSTQILSLIAQSVEHLATTQETKITQNLPFIATEPKIKTADANNFGIKELLGKGTSTFKTSAAIRNSNVAQGAAIVNRILIAPGETFSFIKTLGKVSLANGFKQAYVIKGGKTELDVGGGICQVSTTLFRAMLNAGLNITSRQNHAYRVHYYEEDMPPGYDATVYIPSPDLKFINDTGNYVLIQNTFFDKEKRLTYEIWGTNDGRKVEISNYHQWDSSPPPPARYIDDPTLPPGKVIQDEHAVPGLKTSFDWKVIKNNSILLQKTFTSSYTPWAAVYRRGPTI